LSIRREEPIVETAPGRCPKCGFERQAKAAECPVCGVVFSRLDPTAATAPPGGSPAPDSLVAVPPRSAAPLRPAPPAPFPPPPDRHFPPPPKAPPAGEIDPYAAPRSVGTPAPVNLGLPPDPSWGIWHAGDLIVMSRQATLPNRCVRCGAPAESRLRTKLAWHTPWLYLLLVAPLFYLVVAFLVRQTANVEIPLCGRHRRSRRRGLWIAWGILFASIPVGYAAGVLDQPWLGWMVPLVILIGLIAVVVASRLLVPTRIDRERLWLKSAAPEYLDFLPAGPLLS
jgi:hypothetical protein